MADDEYNQKLGTLQQYIPFLDNMIAQLKDPSKKNREQQLNKMQSLHSMITDKRKKLKLETLIKCEDVISKLYIKVHSKPLCTKTSEEISSTPASPSPPRDILPPAPLTIPTERVEESRIPKIDIYSSAGESLCRSTTFPSLSPAGKLPDMSKPPISLEDLKTLEEDVQEKINESSLKTASLYELNSLREKLTEQIEFEEKLLSSPEKSQKKDLDFINTTVRNNLSLNKKNTSPEKSKHKEHSKTSHDKEHSKTSHEKDHSRTSHDKSSDSHSGATSPKKEHKSSSSASNKPPKVLKEPASIFGSILSHIDDQILESKKKKEERRSSVTGKEEKKKDRKHSKDETNEKKDSKETKKKERRTSLDKSKSKDEKKSKISKELESKKKDRHNQTEDKTKQQTESKDNHNIEKGIEEEIKPSSKETVKDNLSPLGEDNLETNLIDEANNKDKHDEANNKDKHESVESDDKNKDALVGKVNVKTDLYTSKSAHDFFKENENTKSITFKRLADKYNPKPKKPSVVSDIDKEVSDIIEENMKFSSPPKIPLISEIYTSAPTPVPAPVPTLVPTPVPAPVPTPVPPPASFLRYPQLQSEPAPPPQLSAALQNILTPSTTNLINTVMHQLRQNNEQKEARTLPLLPTPPADNFISEYVREEQLAAEYTREDFPRDDFVPNNLQMNDFTRDDFGQNNLQMNDFANLQQPRQDQLIYEPPPLLNNPYNLNHQNPRFMSPRGDGFSDNYAVNRPFTPIPQTFNQPFPNFQPNPPSDMQPLDYYPSNAPIPTNQYNCGPPILSPEVPHFHTEQKPNSFGMMANHDPFVHNEDMRWRQDDNRLTWERRDPRTYREYREMRGSRDPRVTNRDPRAIRDPRVNRDLRENRDPRDSNRDPRDSIRDPRDLGRDSRESSRDPKDSSRDSRETRDPRLNKDRDVRDFDRERTPYSDDRSRPRDSRNKFDNKFDRMYTRTNRDRSRSASRSRFNKESFISPLDSLYTGKEEHKTGKGYGVQNFRIPKIKKEDEDKEQSTKVSSTIDEIETVEDISNNEVTGNDVNTEDVESTEQTEEVIKENTTKEVEAKTIEKEVVEEKSDQEPPKLDVEIEESKKDDPKPSQSVDHEPAKPADQTILAQFFANLLGSQNKKQKKTALYSLISTFSDSFSEKELAKITKIIKADDEVESSEDEEEEEQVKKLTETEVKTDTDTPKEPEKEAEPEESPVKVIKRRRGKRVRRISSTPSINDDLPKEEEKVTEQEPAEPVETPIVEEESVIVTVGERIKSRKRNAASQKPKKKCRTELDMLHEDIQDMFIRDGVLTASGKRMCRLLKNDPNALTSQPGTSISVEPPKQRKKPGPKPKIKPSSLEVKSMKNIRVLLSKIPDSSLESKEGAKRTLRSSLKLSYAESDDDNNSALGENSSITDVETLKDDESEAESTDTEKDKTTPTTELPNKIKGVKRKRGKGWASGNIPSNKKKKKKQLFSEESEDKNTDKDANVQSPMETDKSFVTPNKNQYVDFTSGKPYTCTLCDYKGRFITTHYKTQHPESEIVTSRFSPEIAKEAIEDSIKNLAKYERIVMSSGSGKYNFTCRFCHFTTGTPPTLFYDHISTHTGEYRHVCTQCQFSASNGKTLKAHMFNVHQDTEKRVVRRTYRQSIVFAYLCGDCNYVQLTQKNVEDHINIYHLQKPKIYKINMSTTLNPEVVKLVDGDLQTNVSETASAAVEEQEIKENVANKVMPPPQAKKRLKPGPKSMKEKLKAKRALHEKDGDISDTSSLAESEDSSTIESEVSIDQSPAKPVASRKRQSREVSVSSEEEILLGGRGRRAAKDKAAEKLKTLMEYTENGGKKKTFSSTEEVKKNEQESSNKKDKTPETVAEVENNDKIERVKEPPVIKKEIDLNVFTCKTDIQEEDKKIERERLQRMEELNKSVGSRTTLNFVDKLCNRLSNNDVIVKQEPIDDNALPSTDDRMSPVMPVLEKPLPVPTNDFNTAKTFTSAPPSKKPVLESQEIQVSKASFDVTQKNDKVIMDMIQKLKGKLASASEDKPEESTTAEEMEYDNEGLPPLTHVNELVNIKPADGSTKTLLIGGLVKIIKYSNNLVFSCLLPPCVFSTDSQDIFYTHCVEAHKVQDTSTLCEICGMEVTSTAKNTLLENIFKHALQEHADFMNIVEEKKEVVRPSNSIIRIRKLSGDALSVSKDDVVDKINNEKEKPAELAVIDPKEPEDPVSMAELDISENPFPFKIAGVMSLAEPLPPLAPIAKNALQTPAPLSPKLLVKETKVPAAEACKPRKTQKAMSKFIRNASDLYKCPLYYCFFSTNFRDMFDKHMKAHKLDDEDSIICVYCDMKTPWMQVSMHIDIRHAHCRFACCYCLYRAVIKDYVFLHQDLKHPNNDYSVIALPPHHALKKFSFTETKGDAKTLCHPYKCTPDCRAEFLFENEFVKHLDEHKSEHLCCGFDNCGKLLPITLMSKHWSLMHNISVYQCVYCKMNNNELLKMYQHFAVFHQGLAPEILNRRLLPIQERGHCLGYSSEAFALLGKIVTMPSNIPKPVPPTESSPGPVVFPNTVPYPISGNTALKVVKKPQNAQSVVIPTNSVAITIVSSNTTSTNTSNFIILPTATCNTLGGVVMASQTSTQITSIASPSKLVEVVASDPKIVPSSTVMSKMSVTPLSKTSKPNDVNDEREICQTIEPVEHITVSEDGNQNTEDSDMCDADPLSLDLDADLNDASKSAAESSGDENDVNKLEKSKTGPKSGLLSYQLYRCAFCDISFSNNSDFKRHVTYSTFCREDMNIAKPYVCVHCGKQMRSPAVLVEHIQCHGILKFTCSLCGNKFPTTTQTRSHMKIRHNITHTSVTPLNPAKQNMDVDEFVVRPKLTLQLDAAKEVPSAEPSTSSSENVYTPETIDKIPMRHILSASIKCGLCSYTTKVRTNMVRHLQFHSEEKAVSDTAPVNPVPCLEKNEKMFDKMVNLASSSHTQTRMGGMKPEKEKEIENVPEFVPSHCRYVCCAHGCNYICPEEGNLRHHLIALHGSETSFTCVHCKRSLTPPDADGLLKHFKLHGLQLYKCSYCSFVHNLKHKIEKHITDAHQDQPVKVITARLMESEPKDNNQEASTANSQSTSAPPTNKQYKPWRCCMCKYKTTSEEGIQNHVLEKHEIGAQFKCALCTYKSDDRDTFTDHFKSTHDNQTMDIIFAYRKLEEDKEKDVETFDTTPLWQRDRPRIRHIRGILFDDSSPVATKSPKKKSTVVASSSAPSTSKIIVTPSDSPGPSGVKSAAPSPVPTAAKTSNIDFAIESVVNGTADILKKPTEDSDEFFQTVNKLMKDSNEDIAKVKDSMVIVIDDEDIPKIPMAKNKDNKNAPMAKNRVMKRKATEVLGISKIAKFGEEIIDLDSCTTHLGQDELSSEVDLKLEFGPLGEPMWKQYKCPLCNMFKSKRISDFAFHLFKEVKVFRFKCIICDDESVTYRYMYKHVKDNHLNIVEKYHNYVKYLPPNEKLLTWIQMVITEQSVAIANNYSKSTTQLAAQLNQKVAQCSFCDSKFSSEQEKHEHTVKHFTVKPFSCSSCNYSAYLEGDVVKHFKSVHKEDAWKIMETAMVITKAPTISQLLKISDEQHVKENEKQSSSNIPVEAESESPATIEMRVEDPLGDIPTSEQIVDPLDIPVNIICDETIVEKDDDAVLSDSDLVIVTKTEKAVSMEGDIFCCEYCPFMANSEAHILNHMTTMHQNMGTNFKKLNRTLCDRLDEHVGCGWCPDVGSEINIRQHYMEKHQGQPYVIYKFQCALCSQPKRFLKIGGMRVHFQRCHPGIRMNYTTFYGRNSNDCTIEASKWYKCVKCSYARHLKQSAVQNMRQHLKQHFKSFVCPLCSKTKYKTRPEVIAHCSKEHPDVICPEVVQDMTIVEKYNAAMAEIIASAAASPVPINKVNRIAKKSTSKIQMSGILEEYSYYGNQPEEVDLNKIMTSVEINGMNLNMSAERLSKLFDLNVVVVVPDCNIGLGVSTTLDS